jgi:hypothetical protein
MARLHQGHPLQALYFSKGKMQARMRKERCLGEEKYNIHLNFIPLQTFNCLWSFEVNVICHHQAGADGT